MRLARLTMMTAILAWGVVALGAYVRLSAAGLGCPDWPGCYGHLSVPSEQVAQAVFPDRPLESPKAWKEMVHRYAAGTLGGLILGVFALSWRARGSRVPPVALLAVVAFQALLGRWTVTELLQPAVVTAHLIGGMTVLALLVWMAFPAAGEGVAAGKSLRLWAGMGLAILVVQIALGGWTSSHYAALICGDGLLCQGTWLPRMDFTGGFSLAGGLSGEALTAIQWTHRLGAVVVAGVLAPLAFRLLGVAGLKSFGGLLLGLLVTQLGLGVMNVALGLPLAAAVLHNAVAALLLATMVTLNRKLRERSPL